MASKYFHRRLAPDDFSKLLGRSGLAINDYLFFTGRHIGTLANFLGNGGKAESATMADVLLLELCARDPTMKARMTKIANEYALEWPARAERAGSQ